MIGVPILAGVWATINNSVFILFYYVFKMATSFWGFLKIKPSPSPFHVLSEKASMSIYDFKLAPQPIHQLLGNFHAWGTKVDFARGIFFFSYIVIIGAWNSAGSARGGGIGTNRYLAAGISTTVP